MNAELVRMLDRLDVYRLEAAGTATEIESRQKRLVDSGVRKEADPVWMQRAQVHKEMSQFFAALLQELHVIRPALSR